MMSSNDTVRFRITGWPPSPIPVPPVVRVEAKLVGRLLDYGDVIRAKQTLPPEVALRVIPRIDTDDPDALVELINSYGPLTSPISDSDLELLPYFAQQQIILRAREDPDFDSITTFGAIRIQVASYYIRIIQSLVAHWDAHQRGEDSGVVQAWEWLINGLLISMENLDLSLTSAWDLWTTHLNAALAPATAYVSVQSPNGDGRGWNKDLGATAYSAMAIEIFNDVVTGTPWRRCANEPCRLLFARQVGRAKAGQHRSTGVLYCSSSCANAQGQRNLRRRRAERKLGGAHG